MGRDKAAGKSLLFRQLQFVLETQSEFIEEISEHGAIGLVVAECFGFPLEGSFQLLLGLLDLIAKCLGLFQDARAQVALNAGNWSSSCESFFSSALELSRDSRVSSFRASPRSDFSVFRRWPRDSISSRT